MKDIDILISKFLSDDINVEELEKLHLWLEQSEENKKHFSESKMFWLSLNSYTQHDTELVDSEYDKFLDTIKADDSNENKNAKVIKLDSSKNNISWKKIAAVLIVPFIAGAIYFFPTKKSSELFSSVEMKEIYVPCGTQQNIVLPDGSRVQLNSGSRLQYPIAFNSNTRRVKLSGEGFFDITKDSLHPFIVSVRDLNIRVLGTSFNVNSYSENCIETSLVEGKVELYKSDNKPLAILMPGNKAIYETNKHLVCIPFDKEVEIAWLQGKMIMKNTPINKLIFFMEKKYGVDVIINDSAIMNSKLTGSFENESLVEILDLLKISSSLSYNIKGNKVFISK